MSAPLSTSTISWCDAYYLVDIALKGKHGVTCVPHEVSRPLNFFGRSAADTTILSLNDPLRLTADDRHYSKSVGSNIICTMSPQLWRFSQFATCSFRPATTLSPFAVSSSSIQYRAASILSSLSDNPSAYSKRIRRGRGPSSGKGKTSGRGHKGQKQHGKVPRGFNGGQTKDEVVHGIRGDHNYAK